MSEKRVPIMHGIKFIDKMDALVREFPSLTQEDISKFWEEYRPRIYETYRGYHSWVSFYNLITGIIEDYEE